MSHMETKKTLFYKKMNFPWKKQPESKTPSETMVSIQLPAKLEIGLVQANELRSYELYLALFSLTLSVTASFGTSYATLETGDPGAPTQLFSTFLFGVFTIIFGSLTLYHRAKLYAGTVTKTVPITVFRASEPAPEPDVDRAVLEEMIGSEPEPVQESAQA